jgi:hypothetical protein
MEYNLQRIKTLGYGGYYLVKAPPGFPSNRPYPPEHRVIWWLHNGSLPPDDFHIHHINGDPKDNRIENLEAIHQSEHSKHKHNGGKPPAAYRNVICHYCKKEYQQLERTMRFREKQGQIEFFCCKGHQSSYQNQFRKGVALNYPKSRKSPERKGVNLICKVCKKEYYVAKYREHTSKVCSKECSNLLKTCTFK